MKKIGKKLLKCDQDFYQMGEKLESLKMEVLGGIMDRIGESQPFEIKLGFEKVIIKKDSFRLNEDDLLGIKEYLGFNTYAVSHKMYSLDEEYDHKLVICFFNKEDLRR